MLSAIVVLFGVVVLMVCLHIYARWYLLRLRRHRRRSRRRNRSHIVFYVDSANPTIADRGLDAAILRSLPVFTYSFKTRPDPMECAVCLSEFEEGEAGRLLPKCNHAFHTACIDMWFHSHSTCPLCRSLVEMVPENLAGVDLGVDRGPVEPGSSSRLPPTEALASSLAERRKEFEMGKVTIEVPVRNSSEDDCGPGSPSCQGQKSPSTRFMSIKRILSMNRKSSPASPSTAAVGPSTAEVDIESGMDGSGQNRPGS